jgi:hypothetical protein
MCRERLKPANDDGRDRDGESQRERDDDRPGFRVIAGRLGLIPPIERLGDWAAETNPQDDDAQPPSRAHDGSVTRAIS